MGIDFEKPLETSLLEPVNGMLEHKEQRRNHISSLKTLLKNLNKW